MGRRIAAAILLTVWAILVAGGFSAYWATRAVLLADLDRALVDSARLLPQVTDYAHAEFGEFVDDTDKLVVKKLRFVDPYNFGVRLDIRAHVGRGADVLGFVFHL